MGPSATHRDLLHPELLVRGPGSVTPGSATLDDRRLSSWFSTNDSLAAGGVAIIGFPCDIGVGRNGGRPGAARAPEEIRRALGRLTPDARNAGQYVSLLERSVDLGDILASDLTTGRRDDLENDLLRVLQQRLGRVVEGVLRAGGIPIVLGGGHETAFGHYLGSREVFDHMTILNWDAHADVRPLNNGLGHSGSPFRQALEMDPVHRLAYVVAGLQPQSISADHLRFVNSRGRAIFAEEIDDDVVDSVFDGIRGATQVSFDMDAVDGSEAPGVSAPSVGGLSARTWMRLAEKAGRCPGVTSMDVVEFNPRFDIGGRTARLTAGTVWSFMRGVAGRLGGSTVNQVAT